MFDKIIKFSLNNRIFVLGVSVLLMAYGFFELNRMPIDVFPDLNRPRVTVITEAHGLAPEEVETMVTIPLESVLNGAPGVIQIRSSSGIGISLIYVEFDWNTDIKINRQLVAERLQLARANLPDDITPSMGPVTSIMGEIQFIGLQADPKKVSPLKLRTLADTLVRPRLMTVPGISQVIVMGGGVKQYHILLSSEKLALNNISIEDIKKKISHISVNTTGGFLNIDKSEYLVRALSRAESTADIGNTFIAKRNNKNILLKDLGSIEIGAKEKRGEASINGQHSVVLTIQKQPKANTVELTKKIDALVADLRKTLPPDVKINEDLFKQSKFIENSVSNVKEALRDGAIMIAIVLFMFLMNFRTTVITLTAIPLSILISVIIFKLFGMSINTMTLGGLAIAIGELVDDAIVDVENVLRRLKENQNKKDKENPLKVIFLASKEIRNSIVFSTLIVVLVFIPLFAMSGLEGRLDLPPV
jgi:Cu(I)/Ag(I) efflux system membrane protein CusA/SilA